ncbi:MAG: AAA family ATPase [Hyphomonadaceae bacterium]
MLDLFGSYTEWSPSGTGVKAYARIKLRDLVLLREMLDDRVRKTWSIGAGKHPPGVMLALGGFFAVTNDALDTTPLRTVDIKTVKRVMQIGERIKREAQAKANDAESGWKDESGSGAAWRLAVETRRAGGTFEDFVAAVEDDAEALRSCEQSSRGFDRQCERDWERAAVKVEREELRMIDKFYEHEDDGDSNSDDESDFLTAAQLAAEPRPFDFLEGLLFEQQMSVIYGAPKAGKSFLVMDMACAVGLGHAWAGRQCDARKVLVIPLEGRGTIIDRVRAWEMERKAKCPLVFHTRSWNLIDSKDVKKIIRYVRKHGIGLVIVDTLSRAIPDAEENSATDMGKAVRAGDMIARAGAHVMFVHHANRSGTMRGSNVLLGAPDLVLRVERRGVQRTAIIEENRHGIDGEALRFTLEPRSTDITDARGKRVQSAVVKLEGEWFQDLTGKDAATPKSRLTASEQQALDILRQRTERFGQMSKNRARDLLKRKGWTHKLDADAEAQKKARQRVLASLERKGAIGIDSNDELEIVR